MVKKEKNQDKGNKGGSQMFQDLKKMMPFGREEIINSHRRNIETLTETNRKLAEVMRSVAELQANYVRNLFEDMSSLMRKTSQAVTESVMDTNPERFTESVNKAIEYQREVAQKMQQAQKEIYEIMQARVSEGTQEFKEMNKNAPGKKPN